METNRYTRWQEKLHSRKWYKFVWTFFGIYSIVAVFLLGLFLVFGEYWKVVVIAAIAFVIARGIISPVIFYFYKKQRPYQKYQFTTIHSFLLSTPSERFNSFPSDHALSLAALSTVFYWYIPSVGITMFALMLLNSYARVVLGYHDEWDILGGWVIGILSALLVIYFITPFIFTRI